MISSTDLDSEEVVVKDCVTWSNRTKVPLDYCVLIWKVLSNQLHITVKVEITQSRQNFCDIIKKKQQYSPR